MIDHLRNAREIELRIGDVASSSTTAGSALRRDGTLAIGSARPPDLTPDDQPLPRAPSTRRSAWLATSMSNSHRVELLHCTGEWVNRDDPAGVVRTTKSPQPSRSGRRVASATTSAGLDRQSLQQCSAVIDSQELFGVPSTGRGRRRSRRATRQGTLRRPPGPSRRAMRTTLRREAWPDRQRTTVRRCGTAPARRTRSSTHHGEHRHRPRRAAATSSAVCPMLNTASPKETVGPSVARLWSVLVPNDGTHTTTAGSSRSGTRIDRARRSSATTPPSRAAAALSA